MLVNCDYIVQQKVEISTYRDRSVSRSVACRSRPGSQYPVIPNSTEEDQLGTEKFAASNSSHVVLCQYLLSCTCFADELIFTALLITCHTAGDGDNKPGRLQVL